MVKDRRRYLEFEKGLADLDEQITKLKSLKLQGDVDLSQEIRNLEEKSEALLRSICQGLNSYQKVQLSRHPDRPSCLDYVRLICEDFIEMHGDRNFRDDASIVGGLAQMNGHDILLIGHQKGKNTEENVKRNFGMPRPEGYRKALRLMKMAERFKLPIVTLIDTPGAYPGLDAEERGQAEAIANNIMQMAGIESPTIACVIGEGGSGGALALATSDRVCMLEYSIYSVISPEGCAAITWKDGSYVAAAAEALCLTAQQALSFGVADRVIEEPLGGAHRDHAFAASKLKEALSEEIAKLKALDLSTRLDTRYLRYRKFGVSSDSEANPKTKRKKA